MRLSAVAWAAASLDGSMPLGHGAGGLHGCGSAICMTAALIYGEPGGEWPRVHCVAGVQSDRSDATSVCLTVSELCLWSAVLV